MDYKSPPVGNEISCGFHGIRNDIINDKDFLKNNLEKILKEDNFGIRKILMDQFETGGFSLMITLEESHVAIHTYPEKNYMYFSIYSCRGPEDARKVYKSFKEMINPKKISSYTDKRIPIDENYISENFLNEKPS